MIKVLTITLYPTWSSVSTAYIHCSSKTQSIPLARQLFCYHSLRSRNSDIARHSVQLLYIHVLSGIPCNIVT